MILDSSEINLIMRCLNGISQSLLTNSEYLQTGELYRKIKANWDQGLSICSKTVDKTLHPTEEKYPEQTKMFKQILDDMYIIHLDKNQDYSPYNINATGMIGLVTRIWDKTARIMNLFGFDIGTGSYSKEKQSPKDESIEDNLVDLGVYTIIARIYRAEKWGK